MKLSEKQERDIDNIHIRMYRIFRRLDAAGKTSVSHPSRFLWVLACGNSMIRKIWHM